MVMPWVVDPMIWVQFPVVTYVQLTQQGEYYSYKVEVVGSSPTLNIKTFNLYFDKSKGDKRI